MLNVWLVKIQIRWYEQSDYDLLDSFLAMYQKLIFPYIHNKIREPIVPKSNCSEINCSSLYDVGIVPVFGSYAFGGGRWKRKEDQGKYENGWS